MLGLPAPGRAELTLRWLGVAGFSISDGETVLLHDPFFSRPGLLRTALRRYRPDAEVLTGLLDAAGPAPELARARLILVGHSHYDHLGDAPWLAARTGARLAGSATSAAIARGYGLPAAQTVVVAPGERLFQGPFEIEAVESRHARVLFGRVPLTGTVEEPPEAPIHALSFVLGDARSYQVRHATSGVRIVLLSSAALHRPALEALGGPVDVLLAATTGRDPGYARDLVETLRPRLVVPHHFDSFFRPLAHPEAGAPSDPEDLAAFEAEIGAAALELGVALEVRRLELFESLGLEGQP